MSAQDSVVVRNLTLMIGALVGVFVFMVALARMIAY